MHVYKFIGEYPVIFSALSYGPDVTVVDAAGEERQGTPGSTVILEPGDTVTVDHELQHALLQPPQDEGKPTKKKD